jgi:hypothetical protein
MPMSVFIHSHIQLIAPRPEQAFLALTAEADKGLPTSEAIVAAAFAQLQPVDAAYLTKGAGEWKGHSFSTGHPGHEKLKELNWAGKKFRNKDDVDPVVVYDSEGKRVWSADWGHAQASPSLAEFQTALTQGFMYASCAKCHTKGRTPSRWCTTTSL